MTDGIEEAIGPKQVMFGASRAIDVVLKNRGNAANAVVNALFGATREFTQGEPQADDITAVIIKAL